MPEVFPHIPDDATPEAAVRDFEVQLGVEFPDSIRYSSIAQWHELARLILPVPGSPLHAQLEQMGLLESRIGESTERSIAGEDDPYSPEFPRLGEDMDYWLKSLRFLQPLFELMPAIREPRELPWTTIEEYMELTEESDPMFMPWQSMEEALEVEARRSESHTQERRERYREEREAWFGPDAPTAQ